jgi:hypothetical protein
MGPGVRGGVTPPTRACNLAPPSRGDLGYAHTPPHRVLSPRGIQGGSTCGQGDHVPVGVVAVVQVPLGGDDDRGCDDRGT